MLKPDSRVSHGFKAAQYLLITTVLQYFVPQVGNSEVMWEMWRRRGALPGLVFSSWYQRKKARFFCSLRSDPCCRSQWEIRLWLIPGGRRPESDLGKRGGGGVSAANSFCLRLNGQMMFILTCYLSNHSLGYTSVRQEGFNLLFDHSTVPPRSRDKKKVQHTFKSSALQV